MKAKWIAGMVLIVVSAIAVTEWRYSDDMQNHIATVNADMASAQLATEFNTGLIGSLQTMTAEADVAVATLMGYEAASILDSGVIPTVQVSVEKVYTSELRQRIADLALDLLGPDGLLAHRSQNAPLAGKFERLYRAAPLMRFGGGTNEVLRDIIAQRGHGMPSYGR